jgi:hypothetical protein
MCGAETVLLLTEDTGHGEHLVADNEVNQDEETDEPQTDVFAVISHPVINDANSAGFETHPATSSASGIDGEARGSHRVMTILAFHVGPAPVVPIACGRAYRAGSAPPAHCAGPRRVQCRYSDE